MQNVKQALVDYLNKVGKYGTVINIFSKYQEKTGYSIYEERWGFQSIPFYQQYKDEYVPIIPFEHFALLKGIELKPSTFTSSTGVQIQLDWENKQLTETGFSFKTITELYNFIKENE